MSFNEWETYKLEQVLEVKYGKDHKSLSDGSIPVYGSGGIMRYADTALYNDTSILIPRKGTLNNLFFLDKPFWTVDTMFYTILNKELIDPKFLFYKLTTFNYSEMNVGTAVPSMTVQVLNELEITIPKKPIQEKISFILSTIDDKIENNLATNQNLEEIARTLFKEWFVNFNYSGADGKMKESELGEIPEGWEVGKLRDVIELNPRIQLKKGDAAKYVEMKDLSENSAVIQSFRDRQFSSGSKFQKGDVLLARITPCLENGKTGLVDFLDEVETGWGSTEFIILRGKNFVGSFFTYCLSRYEPFRSFAIQSMVGSSGRQRVVESMILDFDLPLATKEVYLKFEDTVTPFFAKIFANHKQNQTLKQLRNSLLPKLMSGEIIPTNN
jgi:type I restriction enzyme S subunit